MQVVEVLGRIGVSPARTRCRAPDFRRGPLARRSPCARRGRERSPESVDAGARRSACRAPACALHTPAVVSRRDRGTVPLVAFAQRTTKSGVRRHPSPPSTATSTRAGGVLSIRVTAGREATGSQRCRRLERKACVPSGERRGVDCYRSPAVLSTGRASVKSHDRVVSVPRTRSQRRTRPDRTPTLSNAEYCTTCCPDTHRPEANPPPVMATLGGVRSLTVTEAL